MATPAGRLSVSLGWGALTYFRGQRKVEMTRQVLGDKAEGGLAGLLFSAGVTCERIEGSRETSRTPGHCVT